MRNNHLAKGHGASTVDYNNKVSRTALSLIYSQGTPEHWLKNTSCVSFLSRSAVLSVCHSVTQITDENSRLRMFIIFYNLKKVENFTFENSEITPK